MHYYDEPREFDHDDEPLVISQRMLHFEKVDFEKGMNPFPVVSVVVMVLCLFAFFGEVKHGALEDLDRMIAVGALNRDEVKRGEAWRLVSAMFLHGSVDHLLGNLLVLYILGIGCEHGFGRGQFIVLYVAAGIVGSLFSLTAGHTSVGASGAIFGLCGALVTFFWRHREKLHVRDKRIGVVLVIWAAYQMLLGELTPGVDNLAHLGGFLGGAVLGLVLQPALLVGRSAVARHPATLLSLIAAIFCLIYTAAFFIPRLV